MDVKKEYVTKLANHIILANMTEMKGEDLAIDLNRNGHKTYANDLYVVGGRGVYNLIHATYDSLVSEKRQPEADNVAKAFVNAKGEPAWDK